jgi:quercetin dioxygenase-like cupin family protein
MAADPVVVDPQHYQVEYEDDRMRVLRIRYGPHEKSPMHGHPANVVVMLTECDFRFYQPKGAKQDILGHVGQVLCFDEPFEHAPENLGDTPFEAICVELKK